MRKQWNLTTNAFRRFFLVDTYSSCGRYDTGQSKREFLKDWMSFINVVLFKTNLYRMKKGGPGRREFGMECLDESYTDSVPLLFVTAEQCFVERRNLCTLPSTSTSSAVQASANPRHPCPFMW